MSRAVEEREAAPLRLISLDEAARRIGMGRTASYELARRGEFPGATKLGGRWFVSLPRLLEHLGLPED